MSEKRQNKTTASFLHLFQEQILNRSALSPEQAARALNGCSWSLLGFCKSDCKCARYYEEHRRG